MANSGRCTLTINGYTCNVRESEHKNMGHSFRGEPEPGSGEASPADIHKLSMAQQNRKDRDKAKELGLDVDEMRKSAGGASTGEPEPSGYKSFMPDPKFNSESARPVSGTALPIGSGTYRQTDVNPRVTTTAGGTEESVGPRADLERQLAICEQNGTKWAHFKVSEVRTLLTAAPSLTPRCPRHKIEMIRVVRGDGESFWKCALAECPIFISNAAIRSVMQFFSAREAGQ